MPKKAKTRFDFLTTATETRSEWEDLCPVNEYRIVPSGSLPGVVPAALREKCVDSLVLCSGSADGYAYYVVNLLRLDPKDDAVDQQPFCLWFSGSQVAPSGCLVQHGDWDDRSFDVPDGFFDEVRSTGIAPFMELLELPTTASGTLGSLSGSTHTKAFERVVDHVKKLTDDES